MAIFSTAICHVYESVKLYLTI